MIGDVRPMARITDATGLADDDAFYFGNAIGEAGDREINAVADATDWA